MPQSSNAPIGVFDSGIGGLSVLRALRGELPHEHFIYLSDSHYTPYGERGADFIIARSLTIAQHLRQRYGIKALVVGCNTATAVAIEALRAAHPDLLLIGVEPALKPAATLSRTGRVGVLGTRGTLGSPRFAQLLARLQPQAEFVLQPCDGLAMAIEQTVLAPPPLGGNCPVHTLLQRYLGDMGCFGPGPGCIDTLVLGCTHYVFAQAQLHDLIGPQVQLLETGTPVARHTRHLLEKAERAAMAMPAPSSAAPAALTALAALAQCTLLTTGPVSTLHAAAGRWLLLPNPQVAQQAVVEPTPEDVVQGFV